MPIRRVQQQSDRGSIQDLANGDDEKYPPTEQELRVKEIYEHALVTRDDALLASIGLIPINGSAKDPVSIFRHREYIKSLSTELADKIAEATQELEGCLSVNDDSVPDELKWPRYKQAQSLSAILGPEELVKTASDDDSYVPPRRSFRRVIK